MGLDLSKNNFKELSEHAGHDIQCSCYGDDNAVIECHTCNMILLSYDRVICPECGTEFHDEDGCTSATDEETHIIDHGKCLNCHKEWQNK